MSSRCHSPLAHDQARLHSTIGAEKLLDLHHTIRVSVQYHCSSVMFNVIVPYVHYVHGRDFCNHASWGHGCLHVEMKAHMGKLATCPGSLNIIPLYRDVSDIQASLIAILGLSDDYLLAAMHHQLVAHQSSP
eukprot:920406-Amphidinium_carterae.1